MMGDGEWLMSAGLDWTGLGWGQMPFNQTDFDQFDSTRRQPVDHLLFNVGSGCPVQLSNWWGQQLWLCLVGQHSRSGDVRRCIGRMGGGVRGQPDKVQCFCIVACALACIFWNCTSQTDMEIGTTSRNSTSLGTSGAIWPRVGITNTHSGASSGAPQLCRTSSLGCDRDTDILHTQI